MEASNRDLAQGTQPLNLDVVDELERIIKRLRQERGQVTLEAVFADGSYVRGFIKQGPIDKPLMRELGDIGAS